MRPIQLKISDLARVAEVTRFQADGLLDEVFVNQPLGKKSGGSHRTFSPQEMLVYVVAHEIEQKYGVRRSILALIADHLRRALTGPRPASREARLLVTFVPPSTTYLNSGTQVEEGIVLHLGPVFARVDEYLGVSGLHGANNQLPLPPVIATRRPGGTQSG